jgi:flagellar hook-length control protein FliK
LRQSLQQLTDRLSNGETQTAQDAHLEVTLKQALNAVHQLTASKASGDQAGGVESTTETTTAQKSAISAAGEKAVAVSQSASAAIEVQTEVRKTVVPLRNPTWQFQPVSGTEASLQTDGQAPLAAVESADSSGQNDSAPAWTYLKGDNAVIPTSVPANVSSSPQVPVQQFAEQMGKFLVKQFNLTQGHGTAEAKISLHPEHLGQVDIKIMIQNGMLTAQFVTENGAARDMLENQMSQLRTALQAQGLQVDKMEVVQQSTSTESASFFQQQHGQSGSGNQGSSSNGRSSRSIYDDSAGFEAELDRTSFMREIGYGSSLNVTA